jgi:hypothetical protein
MFKEGNSTPRLLYDLMHYLEENDLDGLLLLVDFEKAFDSIEWEFLIKALKSFRVSLLINDKTCFNRFASTAEDIFMSVLSKLIGRQLPMYLLSLPDTCNNSLTLKLRQITRCGF